MTVPRLAAVGAAAAALALAACSPAPPATGPAPSAPATAAPTPPAEPGAAAAVFGPACDWLPQGDGPGSLAAMRRQPVATAVSANPLLTTLATAVKAVPGLPDTLDNTQGLTVFAPSDDAFAALPRPTWQALLKDTTKLDGLLSYHLVGQRYDAASLVAAEQATALAGGTLAIGGTATAPTVTDGQGDTAAVLCGNIPTANATVFVIDRVLMPKS